MSVAAGTLVGLCQLALEGADKLVGQLNFPALAWIRGLPWKLGVRLFDPFFIDISKSLYRGRFPRIPWTWVAVLHTFRNLLC